MPPAATAKTDKRRKLTHATAPADYPRYYDESTDFGSSSDTLHPKWIVDTIQKHPLIWGPLQAAANGSSHFGRRRTDGDWALVYLAFVWSQLPDVRPFWQRAGHSIWTGAGFAERPSYATCQRRFGELEKPEHSQAFADAAATLVQAAARATGGHVGKYVHVDGTEAETHARLQHVCPADSPCWTKGAGVRITAQESVNYVRERRHDAAQKPEPDVVDDPTDMDFGEAKEHRRGPNGSLRVKVKGCWYEILDGTAGIRAYHHGAPGARQVRKFWVGFYNHKAIDHFTGAPLAVHVCSASE